MCSICIFELCSKSLFQLLVSGFHSECAHLFHYGHKTYSDNNDILLEFSFFRAVYVYIVWLCLRDFLFPVQEVEYKKKTRNVLTTGSLSSFHHHGCFYRIRIRKDTLRQQELTGNFFNALMRSGVSLFLLFSVSASYVSEAPFKTSIERNIEKFRINEIYHCTAIPRSWGRIINQKKFFHAFDVVIMDFPAFLPLLSSLHRPDKT